MKLEHRFLLQEIDVMLDLPRTRKEVRQKMLDEIKEYAKTEHGKEFLLELHKSLSDFVLFFKENGLPHIKELVDNGPF